MGHSSCHDIPLCVLNTLNVQTVSNFTQYIHVHLLKLHYNMSYKKTYGNFYLNYHVLIQSIFDFKTFGLEF